ncbi:uncharacterized protein TrAtP1_000451 [Trichoderma atroviride]|uniref:uncharacterized protein n=1 Tax=Hypocrea atroviridis TaxID=63577 RepID=UPI0033205A3E|nr:hypothetical protein TrAtP1_000451 [Trichoderma atroviride]
MGLVVDDPAMGIELLPDSGHSQGHPSDGLGPERGEVTQADDSGSHRPPHQTHTTSIYDTHEMS